MKTIFNIGFTGQPATFKREAGMLAQNSGALWVRAAITNGWVCINNARAKGDDWPPVGATIADSSIGDAEILRPGARVYLDITE